MSCIRPSRILFLRARRAALQTLCPQLCARNPPPPRLVLHLKCLDVSLHLLVNLRVAPRTITLRANRKLCARFPRGRTNLPWNRRALRRPVQFQ